jgi:hypothetical protein
MLVGQSRLVRLKENNMKILTEEQVKVVASEQRMIMGTTLLCIWMPCKQQAKVKFEHSEQVNYGGNNNKKSEGRSGNKKKIKKSSKESKERLKYSLYN